MNRALSRTFSTRTVHRLADWIGAVEQASRDSVQCKLRGQEPWDLLVQTPPLVEPFLRGTERIHTDHAGVGLGLAIVTSITQAHDGTLTLTPRPAGGLCVTVQLPTAGVLTTADRPKGPGHQGDPEERARRAGQDIVVTRIRLRREECPGGRR